jgi:serine/threonine protein kinase
LLFFNSIYSRQWLAPEVMTSQTYTEKSDVYSFAIILWELATRQEPFANFSVSYQFPFLFTNVYI